MSGDSRKEANDLEKSGEKRKREMVEFLEEVKANKAKRGYLTDEELATIDEAVKELDELIERLEGVAAKEGSGDSTKETAKEVVRDSIDRPLANLDPASPEAQKLTKDKELLEEKRGFDRMTAMEKKEWALSITDYYWEKLNKISSDEIEGLDRALTEIPEDSTEIKERLLLNKAQIVNRQLEAVELVRKNNFDPVQIFRLRLEILYLSKNIESLTDFEGTKESPGELKT